MAAMKFLTGEPALLLEAREKTLIISDLHLGIEYEFYKSGIKIPSQIDALRKRIEKLLRTSNAERLIILGDVKHKVPGISWQESREVPEFVNRLNRKVRVEILPGNHDPGLSGLIPNIKIYPSKGILLGNCYLLHGHTWPSPDFLKANHVIIGHNHPLIEFRDKLGYCWRESVWVRTELNRKKLDGKYKKIPKLLPELVIMPVFNSFSGGIGLNRPQNGFMGPLGKCADTKKAKIYLLDGTFLGRLGDWSH